MIAANKVFSGILDGVNSLFYGDKTILTKITWIRNDSEAIYEDWKKVGMDIAEATNITVKSRYGKKEKKAEKA